MKYLPEGRKPWDCYDITLVALERLFHDKPYEAIHFDYKYTKSKAYDKTEIYFDKFFEFIVPRLFYLQSLNVIDAHIPEEFKKYFPYTRFIVDGLPQSVSDSGLYFTHQLNYSAYKHEEIELLVLGISPDGLAQFRSPLYCGSASETNNCLPGGKIFQRIRKVFDISDEKMKKISELLAKYDAMSDKTLSHLREEANRRSITHAGLSAKQLLTKIQAAMFAEIRPHLIPVFMGDGAYDRLHISLARLGLDVITPKSLPADGRQMSEKDVLESSKVSVKRGLVERVIRVIKQYQELGNAKFSNADKSEKRVDIVMGLYNLNLLAKTGRLDEIPSLEDVKDKYFNPLTDAMLPNRTKLHETPARDVSKTLRSLIIELPNITDNDIIEWSTVEGETKPREKPRERGESHVRSSHFLSHSLGRSESGTLLILSKCLASYRKDTSYWIISEWAGKRRIHIYCNCPAGASEKFICGHECGQAVDIMDYLNIKTPGYDRPGKFLCVRASGPSNLLALCRFFPIKYIADEVLPTLGKAFIVTPTTLDKPLTLFKPSKAEWAIIRKHRDENKSPPPEGRFTCICQDPVIAGPQSIKCKSCHSISHKSCLSNARKDFNNFYCGQCTYKYISIARPPIKTFQQMKALAEAEGIKFRSSKKAKAVRSKAALQGRDLAQERHDLHVGIEYSPNGNKRRAVTRNEFAAMRDMSPDEVDMDHDILEENDLESDDEALGNVNSDEEMNEESEFEEEIIEKEEVEEDAMDIDG